MRHPSQYVKVVQVHSFHSADICAPGDRHPELNSDFSYGILKQVET